MAKDSGGAKMTDLHAGMTNKSPVGDGSSGDKSLGMAGGHTINSESTRSKVPDVSAPGPRVA